MKKVRSLLFVLAGTLFFGFNSHVQKTTTAQIGYGLTQLCKTQGAGKVLVCAGFTAIGVQVGARCGASIGWLGGPGGAVLGACVGAL